MKKGNRFWRDHAKPLKALQTFKTPEELYRRCVAYFEWVEDNPLYEAKLVSYKGHAKLFRVPKARVMSLKAMCSFIGISDETWRNWVRIKLREDLMPVIEWAEGVIYQQKFEGAAAELFNTGLIIRDLGLADKQEITGRDGAPIETINTSMTPKEAAEAYAATLHDQ